MRARMVVFTLLALLALVAGACGNRAGDEDSGERSAATMAAVSRWAPGAGPGPPTSG